MQHRRRIALSRRAGPLRPCVSDYLRREEAFAIPAGSARASRARLPEDPGLLLLRAGEHADPAGRLARPNLVAGTAAEADACPELDGFAEEAEEWTTTTAPPRRDGAPVLRLMRDRPRRASRLRPAWPRHQASNAKGDALSRGLDRALHRGQGLRLAREGGGLHRVPPHPGLPGQAPRGRAATR